MLVCIQFDQFYLPQTFELQGHKFSMEKERMKETHFSKSLKI